jgi:A1 cistron-splicing factor AAR2
MMAANQPSPTSTLILSDLPAKTFVGLDLITFTSTSNFHGIKDLPKGWHFFYTGTSESLSLRCGAWFYIGDNATAGTTGQGDQPISITQGVRSEVRIWKWNRDTETLIPLKREFDLDKQEAMRYKTNLRTLWQSGGLFKYRNRAPTNGREGRDQQLRNLDSKDEGAGRSDWIGLTKWLSPRLLSRVLGEPDFDIDGQPRWTLTSASTAAYDADQIPGPTGGQFANDTISELESELRFLPVDLKRTWPE